MKATLRLALEDARYNQSVWRGIARDPDSEHHALADEELRREALRIERILEHLRSL